MQNEKIVEGILRIRTTGEPENIRKAVERYLNLKFTDIEYVWDGGNGKSVNGTGT